MKAKVRLMLAASWLMASALVWAAGYTPKAGETVVKMSFKEKGDVYLLMLPKEAPKTVANFVGLVKEKFYNGIRVHRVVPNFVVQAGDPESKKLDINDPSLGTHGSGKPVDFETNKLTHVKGTLSMALTAPQSATGDSQFFINLKDNLRLNGDYCVFGKVVSGMDVVEKLQKGDTIQAATVMTGQASKAKKQPAKPKKPAKKAGKK